MREVKVGKVYKHFKGHEYEVLAIARHTETDEMMVVYRDKNHQEKVYVRPYDMFISQVDLKKYPDVKQKYRFEEQ